MFVTFSIAGKILVWIILTVHAFIQRRINCLGYTVQQNLQNMIQDLDITARGSWWDNMFLSVIFTSKILPNDKGLFCRIVQIAIANWWARIAQFCWLQWSLQIFSLVLNIKIHPKSFDLKKIEEYLPGCNVLKIRIVFYIYGFASRIHRWLECEIQLFNRP